MSPPFLSRFTPSLMPAETLETLFVQRHELADRIVELLRDSALTPGKHHWLLVGPRGIGKTYLASIVCNRVLQMEDLQPRLHLAWLREEEWGINSFLDLILAILRALDERYPDRRLAERTREIYATPDRAEILALQILCDFVGERTLLLVIENLDAVFAALGKDGQGKLRAYVQENPFWTILATSTALFNGVSLQTSPFYGFFRIEHLAELSFDEVVELLAVIAGQRQADEGQELAKFIRTPVGRARIRAVHHLASGNHRIYVIFSEFLTRSALDQLVDAVLRMMDELTPYYQSRMQFLSPQQRKIVDYLCARRNPITVKEIAAGCLIKHQTASAQLGKLRNYGYIRSTPVGRESYYELREPLMRLCLEIKKQRGEPIQLLVEFLRLWYTQPELKRWLEQLPADGDSKRRYISMALEMFSSADDPLITACQRDFERFVKLEDYEHAYEVAEELVAQRGEAADWLAKARSAAGLDNLEEALHCIDEALRKSEPNAPLLSVRAGLLVRLGKAEEAVEAATQAVSIDPDFGLGWFLLSIAQYLLNRLDDAVGAGERAVAADPDSAWGWTHLGTVLNDSDKPEEALAALDHAIESDEAGAAARFEHARSLFSLGRYGDALASMQRAIDMVPDSARAWQGRAACLAMLGRLDDCLESLDKAGALSPEESGIWGGRGLVLNELGRFADAVESYAKALQINPRDAGAWAGLVLARIRLQRWPEALATVDEALTALGTDDVNTLDCARHPINLLFDEMHDESRFRRTLADIVEMFDRHDFAQFLAVGLVAGVALQVRQGRVDSIRSAMWLGSIRTVLGHRKEFAATLRMIDVVLRYHQSRDERVLLELPAEERALLTDTMGLKQSDAGDQP